MVAKAVAVFALPPMFSAAAVPVRFVATPLTGVPSAGAVNVGLVSVRPATVDAVDPNATEVEPMVTAAFASDALATGLVTTPPLVFTAIPNAVAAPVPNPLKPDRGAEVAAIVPLPEAASDAPVPTTIAAEVFVLPVSDENAVAEDPAQDPHTGAAPTDPVPVSVRHNVEELVLAAVVPVVPVPV